MGICFVGERKKFAGFLGSFLNKCVSTGGLIPQYHSIGGYIPSSPGPILDLTTKKRIGTHQGLWTYTIGQGAKIAGLPTKMFVARKDLASNTVFVVPGT